MKVAALSVIFLFSCVFLPFFNDSYASTAAEPSWNGYHLGMSGPAAIAVHPGTLADRCIPPDTFENILCTAVKFGKIKTEVDLVFGGVPIVLERMAFVVVSKKNCADKSGSLFDLIEQKYGRPDGTIRQIMSQPFELLTSSDIVNYLWNLPGGVNLYYSPGVDTPNFGCSYFSFVPAPVAPPQSHF